MPLIPRLLAATSILAGMAIAWSAELPHRLKEGKQLRVRVDISKVLRKENPLVRGISMHGLTGYLRHPYAVGGKYQLEQAVLESVQELAIPNSRVFMTTRNGDITQEQVVDKAAEIYRKFGVPLNRVVLCINNDELRNPKRVIEIIAHARKRGYGFTLWELGNEPWNKGAVPKALFNRDPKEYQRQALNVAKAIRNYDPKLKIVIPVVHELASPWSTGTMKAMAGYYDYVAGHHYGFSRFYRCTFEGMALTENYMILQNIQAMNRVLKQLNPGREVHQWDTEWGMHSKSYDAQGEPKEPALKPPFCLQNANIMGTLHRAVRLIYYTREDFVRGASSWELFSRKHIPGFGILTRDVPDQRFMIYWLYRHFPQYVGENILDITGECPYYSATRKEHFQVKDRVTGPLTPVLASYDPQDDELFFIIANGSWTKSVPSVIESVGFTGKEVSAIILSHDDPEAHPLVAKESDIINPLAVQLAGNQIRFTTPPHSVVFIRATR